MRTQRTIRTCPVRMQFSCPKTWEGLQPTVDSGVRHCAQCNEDVHFCRTDEETLRHARAGHCIAREEPHPDELPYLVLGRPAIPPVITPEQERASELDTRERGITYALDNARSEGARDCPQCGYPVPSFGKTCYVCAFELGRG